MENIRYSRETVAPAICPFTNSAGRCLASSSGLVPDLPRKLKYCLCDDFDNCPFFLFRCLCPAQSSRPPSRTGTRIESGFCDH